MPQQLAKIRMSTARHKLVTHCAQDIEVTGEIDFLTQMIKMTKVLWLWEKSIQYYILLS